MGVCMCGCGCVCGGRGGGEGGESQVPYYNEVGIAEQQNVGNWVGTMIKKKFRIQLPIFHYESM